MLTCYNKPQCKHSLAADNFRGLVPGCQRVDGAAAGPLGGYKGGVKVEYEHTNTVLLGITPAGAGNVAVPGHRFDDAAR